MIASLLMAAALAAAEPAPSLLDAEPGSCRELPRLEAQHRKMVANLADQPRMVEGLKATMEERRAKCAADRAKPPGDRKTTTRLWGNAQ